MSCWLVPVGRLGYYQCDEKRQRYANPSHLGSLLKFDVLPATFGEFVALASSGSGGVRMAWDGRFPTLQDGDGDGLLSAAVGGIDPNDSTVDTDNDGLTDFWELENNFNPQVADADNDGLIDYWELFHGTNPVAPDTDSDGLLDGEEVFHPASYAGAPENTADSWSGGWQIVYEYDNGTPKLTAVAADPNLPDTDADLNSDHYEFIYKFNPRAPYSVEPLKIESADVKASPENDYVVKAGNSFNYSVRVQSNLDTILQSRGLMEAELPEDTVQQTQSFILGGQEVMTFTGSLYADPARFPQTQSTNVTLRAGAVTEDVGTVTEISPGTSTLKRVITLNGISVANSAGYNTIPERSGNGGNGRCWINAAAGFLNCPDFSSGYANFDTDDSVSGLFALNDALVAPFTASFWVLPNQAFAADRNLFQMNNVNGTVLEAKVAANGTQIYADFHNGAGCANTSTTRVNSGGTLIWNQWNHVVFRYDGTNAAIFANGQGGTNVAVPALCGTIFEWVLGGTGAAANAFVGGMRDLALYSHSQSDVEIQRESATGFRLYEFRFDEPPASKIFSDVRNSRKIECLYEPCPEAGLPALNNQALFFENNVRNDSLDFMWNAADFGFGADVSFTIMGWVNATTWSGVRDLIVANPRLGFGTYNTYKPASFGVRDNKLYMAGYDPTSGTVQEYVTTDPTLAANEWMHLAWQRDVATNVVRLFVNGVQAGEFPAANFVVPTDTVLNLGGNYTIDQVDNYRGWLDHLIIASQALSAAEIQNAMAETPVLNLHLDEEAGAAGFVNSGTGDVTISCTPAASQGNCPTSGERGQMREAPIFTTSQSLTLGGADLSTLAANDATVMFWVRPDFNLPTAQTLVQHGGMEIKRTADNKIIFCDGSTATTLSGATIPADRWSHIAATSVGFPSNRTLYINGQPDVTATVSTVAGNCASSSSQIGGNFLGKLDEIALYNRPLIPAQIQEQYEYQARWFDARIRPVVLVDNDPPVGEFHVSGQYLSQADGQKILLTAADTGMGVAQILPPTLSRPWGAYRLLATAPLTETNAILSIPDGYLIGGGTFYLETWVIDHAGFGTKVSKTFEVDAHPPEATLNAYPNVLPVTGDTTSSVSIGGTVKDGANGFSPVSGIDTSSVYVRLLENGSAVSSYLPATVAGNQWQVTVPFDAPPYGTYNVELTAQDRVGNSFQEILGAVQLNGLAPQGGVLMSRDVISSTNTTVHGFAHTLPYPENASLHLPFVAAAPLVDGSSKMHPITCSPCPTTGVVGRYGEGATFAGNGDAIQVSQALTTPITAAESTLMLWFQPKWTSSVNGYDPVLASTNGHTISLDRNLQSIMINNGSTTASVPAPLNNNVWHHLALVSDGTTWTAYVDGTATGTVTQTLTLGLPMTLGAASNGILGTVDELLWYNRAIQPEEIYDIANVLNTGIAQTQLNLNSLATGADSWRDLTLDQPNSSFSSWSYTIGDAVEAPHRMDLMLTDTLGFTSTIGPVWTGLIDTMAPRVSAAVSFDTANGQVQLSCSADDQYLVDSSWDCTLPNTPVASYETAPWYVSTFSDTQHVIGLNSGIGTLPIQSVQVAACDAVGQCSTDLIEQPGDGGLATIPEISDYQLVYKLDPGIDEDYDLGGPPTYSIDNSTQVGAFDRVAYYLEMENANERQWIYVSMDAFNGNAAQIGVPYNFAADQTVANLNVLSNVSGITTGGPFATGNIEFWGGAYNATADSGIGGSSTAFDFDDSRDPFCCYGSMQVHRPDIGQTLFAYNRWMVAGADDVGIGTGINPTEPDWTFAANASNWITRTLTVLARPTAAAVDDSYAVIPGQPLTVNAPGVLGNDQGLISATLSVLPTHGTVMLQPDGSFTYTLTDDVASDSFTYQATDGHFLQTIATVNLNRSTATCLVETTGDSVTDDASADASALRNAIQAASPGATIKVAGTCAGAVNGSVITIDKALTLDGGHLPTDWLAPSQPITNQAAIDGLNAGIPIRITAPGALAAQGLVVTNGANGDSIGGGGIQNLGRLTLRDSTVRNNRQANFYGGGGIYSSNWLSMTNVIVEANQANYGGGIYNLGGFMQIDRSTIVRNSEGGIGNENESNGVTGVLQMTNTVVRDNTASPGIVNNGDATVDQSAIINNESTFGAGGVENTGIITITNSTISGNRNPSNFDDTPSGFHMSFETNRPAVGFTIRNSTIVSNTGPNNANIPGIFYHFDSGSPTFHMVMEGNVVAHNGSVNCRGKIDFSNTPFAPSGSHNLASDASCNFAVADPQLAPLSRSTSYRATELTHLPRATSPLIDGMPPGTAGCGTLIQTDQRGFQRDDWGCDIGAAEWQLSDFHTMTKAVTQGNSYTFGGPLQVIVNVVNDGGCLSGLTVERFANTHPNATTHTDPNDFWTLTPQGTCANDGTDGLSIDLTLPLENPNSNDRICRYTGSGQSWDCAVGTSNGNTITRQNINQFSDWAIERTPADAVAIVTPMMGSTLTLGVSTPATITGDAFDADGIATVALDVNGAPLAIINGSGVNNLPWSQLWSPAASGLYTLTATLTDQLNNIVTDIVRVTVEDALITGLAATTDGPHSLGASTALTATVTAGTGLAYTWDLGDGNRTSGAVINHAYDTPGTYTAIVTATNSVTFQVASTVVTIHNLVDLQLDKRVTPTAAAPGAPVTYTLTISNAGPGIASNVKLTDALPSGISVTNISLATNNLLAHWPLDEGNGTIATDASGNQHDGTLVNGAAWVTDVPSLQPPSQNAVQFDGSNDYINVPDNPQLRIANNFTVAFWFKAGSTNQYQAYLLNRDNRAAVIYEYVDNAVEFFAGGYSGANPRDGSQMTIADTNWHHIAYSYDGVNWAGYVDGVQIFNQPRTFALDAVTVADWTIGTATAAVGFVNGAMDDVRIYSRGLSSNEIAALVNGIGCVSGQTVTCNVGAVPAGQNQTITISGVLSDTLQQDTVLTNAATVATTDTEVTTANNSDGANVTVLGPDMSVQYQGTTIFIGDSTPSTSDGTDFGVHGLGSGPITRTFSIVNSGQADLTLNHTPKVTLSGAGVASFSIAIQPNSPIAPNGTTTFDIAFTPTTPGSVNATVTVSDTNDRYAPTYHFMIEGTGAAPDLSLTKSVMPSSATPGEVVTYTLAFANQGTFPASGVVITDMVPISLTNLSVSSNKLITATGGSNYVWQVEGLGIGEAGQIQVTGQFTVPLAMGVITNTAMIATNAGESDETNNQSSALLTIENAAPVLAPIAAQTITETQMVTFSATANDANGDNLTFGASGLPSGAMLDSSGYFTWTTTELDGPGVYTVTVVVSDTGLPVRTASQQVVLTVNEANIAPILAPIPAQIISETVTLAFTANATDSDLPAQTLTYGLIDAPTGAAIDGTGRFAWTPSEVQGGSSYSFTVIVRDTVVGDTVVGGTRVLTDSQPVVVNVLKMNSPPVLPTIPAQSIVETQTLTFSAAATDSDHPTQTLSYGLQGAPAGTLIDGNGLVTWIPSESTPLGDYAFTVVVSDTGSPVLTDSQQVEVSVTELNMAPTLAAIPTQAISETHTLTFTVAASDNDIPTQTLSYGLQNAPTGAVLDSAGRFSWTPTEAQGGGISGMVHTFSVVVTDSLGLAASQPVSITVYEVNQAPMLAPIGNQAISAQQPFSLTLSATDLDLPTNMLTYSVLDAPISSGLNGNIFNWTPTVAQASGVYSMTFVVSDNGVPVMTDAETVNFSISSILTYSVTVHNIGDGSGNVTLDPPGGAYKTGTIISLTAIADSGSTFGGWTFGEGSSAVSGVLNPTALAVDGNKRVTATFVPTPTEPVTPAVALTAKSVVQENETIIVRWTTVDESSVMGFHIWREGADGQRVRVTEAAIMAEQSGQSGGMEYAWQELLPSQDGTIRYYVEVVQLSGETLLVDAGMVTPVRSGREIFLPIVMR